MTDETLAHNYCIDCEELHDETQFYCPNSASLGYRPVVGALIGWDDNGVYFWRGDREYPVHEEPELYALLVRACKEYFETKWQTGQGSELE